ncbi:hypothetical protein [Methylobacterium sp. J-068]|uniref:hypothetical protein n=1 Tax=Methylobacterium sp. J-068 TaxID=2836649 RepID=UPI001FB92C0C|nr:hypothetical protein [Methylobacterium sp. J-068]MCJ2032728.1 hypothetical protein [Methylobacterium sp. J-068]
MYVRMKKAFPFKGDQGEKLTAPRGWIGNLPDEVAEAAIKGGFAVDGRQISSTPTAPPAPEDVDDGLEAKTKPELEALAADRGVDISKAKTKADVIEALRKP